MCLTAKPTRVWAGSTSHAPVSIWVSVGVAVAVVIRGLPFKFACASNHITCVRKQQPIEWRYGACCENRPGRTARAGLAGVPGVARADRVQLPPDARTRRRDATRLQLH